MITLEAAQRESEIVKQRLAEQEKQKRSLNKITKMVTIGGIALVAVLVVVSMEL